MKRHLACALALVVGCAACGGSGESAESTTTSEQTTSSSSTSSSSTTSSTLFIFNENPPPLENQGEDFEAILTSLLAFNEWLAVHPDPEAADLVFTQDSEFLTSTKRLFERMLAENLTATTSGVALPISVEVTDNIGEDAVLLLAVLPRFGFELRNPDGTVVESSEPGPDRSVAVELRREAQTWKIKDITQLGDNP